MARRQLHGPYQGYDIDGVVESDKDKLFQSIEENLHGAFPERVIWESFRARSWGEICQKNGLLTFRILELAAQAINQNRLSDALRFVFEAGFVWRNQFSEVDSETDKRKRILGALKARKAASSMKRDVARVELVRRMQANPKLKKTAALTAMSKTGKYGSLRTLKGYCKDIASTELGAATS